MKRALFFLVFTMVTSTSTCQLRGFILPGKTRLNKVSWRDSVYLLNRFHEGELIFDTGFKSPKKHMMNFNFFLDRMDEITPEGDTVALESPPLQHTIRIANHEFRFFPNKGYMRMLEVGKVSVATFYYFDVGRIQILSSGYSTEKSRVPISGDNRTQPVEYDRSYLLHIEPYLISNNDFYHARESNISNLFPEDSGIVEYYMQNHNTDLDNVNSLIPLIRFLNHMDGKPEKEIPGMFRAKAGEVMSKNWRDSLYLLPTFSTADVKGSVTTKSIKPIMMNYNLLTGEMDYLTNAGDTLQFNNNGVTEISFDNRRFLKQPAGGFAELLIQGSDSFFELKRLKVVQVYKNPEAAKILTRYTHGEDVSGDRLCIIRSSYFFYSERSQFAYPADKNGFSRAFPKCRKKMTTHLKTNPVDFEKKDDLMGLISFCIQN